MGYSTWCVLIFLAASLSTAQGLKCSYTCRQSYRDTTACGLWGWGRCTRYRFRTTTCYRCCEGWQGPIADNCPNPVCFGSTTCPNGGTCYRPNYCRSCDEGYASPRCAPVCFGSTTCPNGGTCSRPNYCVSCNHGYSSPRCALVCFGSTICPNGGTCSRPNYCVSCNQGYSSPRCAPVCFGSTTCPNGGTCVWPDYCFSCYQGFFPPRCALDTTPPQIECPFDISKTADPGSANTSVAFAQPIVSDEHGLARVNCSVQSGQYIPIGLHNITCSASDVNGNIEMCLFIITIIDEEKPLLGSCPQSMSLIVEDVAYTAFDDWIPPFATDNSGTVHVSSTVNTVQSLYPGVHNVTYTATDPAGLTATCSFEITIKTNENECTLPAVTEECIAKGLTCINQLNSYTCGCPVGYYMDEISDICTHGQNFHVTITIDAIFNKSSEAVFTEDLGNSTSVSFLTHKERLQHLLVGAFDAMPGFGTVVVSSFRSGSIIVDTAVTFDPTITVTADDVQNNLTSAILHGDLLNGSEYSILPREIKSDEEICVDGFCQTEGTCEQKSISLRLCTCPSGYSAGDECHQTIPPSVGPRKPLPIAVICAAAGAVTFVVLVGVIIACVLRSRRLKEKNNSQPDSEQRTSKNLELMTRKNLEQELCRNLKTFENSVVLESRSTTSGVDIK